MSKIFRHYKNKDYKFIGTAKHSETLEPLAIYTCLYENPMGQLWARPEDLFFGELEIDGKTQRRFREFHYTLQICENLQNHKSALLKLIAQIFPSFSIEKFEQKISQQKNVQLWSIFDGDQMVGFKLGYEQNTGAYYSWLGGVLPAYRGRGIAQQLMKAQHDWCKEFGYKKVVTKTKNEWRQMLLLNIQSGFQIIATEKNTDGELKIVLEKIL